MAFGGAYPAMQVWFHWFRIQWGGQFHIAAPIQVAFQWHPNDIGVTISAASLDIVTLSAYLDDACEITKLVVQISETSDDELHIHRCAISVFDVYVQGSACGCCSKLWTPF